MNALLLLLLAAALGARPVAAALVAMEPSETILAAMEARVEKAITTKLEKRMGADLAEQQSKIAALETKLEWHAQQLGVLANMDEKQQAQLELCAPWNSTAPPPAAQIELVAAELTELRTKQERRFKSKSAGDAAQQAQIDALIAHDEDERRRLQSEGPASQGQFVRIYKVTVDAASLAAQAGGGKRRVLAEEVSCTKDYVHQHTVAISSECPPGRRACLLHTLLGC
jgi:hypothetical protein